MTKKQTIYRFYRFTKINYRKYIQAGLSQRKVATKFAVTQVQKLWKKFSQIGCVADVNGRGRKRATSYRDDLRIVREIKKNPRTTIRAIQDNLQLDVSHKTIRRRLRDAGLHSWY